MDDIRLSICIPTYNFGEFIGATLQSIIKQATDEVEIVVVDGASTDNTAEVVRAFQKQFQNLSYHRLDKRGGIDRDMAKAVELARGQYSWLFSSDDVMKDDAIKSIVEEIKLGFDMYLCGFTLCTREMRPIKDHAILNIKSNAEFDLSKQEDRLIYFNLAQTTSAFFSFMGSLVFKKSRWDGMEIDETFVGSLWAHVARIFRMIPDGLRLKYLAKPYLYKRGDNDSFMDKGPVHRFRMAIEGYYRLADTFFNKNSFEVFHIKRVVRNEFPPGRFLEAKLYIKEKGETRDTELLNHLVAQVYNGSSLLNKSYLLLYKVVPLYPFKVARSSYRKAKSFLHGWKT